ncbi:C-C motif chemokine 20 isoform X2 [Brachionichthys hirsutus]|uniref:C-C motif chemokine 20 isoform X2 n=1 Tax=Brachionichthys hirsutus TaxID=412623 RepID=UPI003604F4E6
MAKLIGCVFIMLVLLGALSECSPNCCTQYHESPVPKKFLKYYRVQRDTDYCNLNAVIFMTVKNKLLCADPARKWVQRAMTFVPQKL